jgi:hypothetical protein
MTDQAYHTGPPVRAAASPPLRSVLLSPASRTVLSGFHHAAIDALIALDAPALTDTQRQEVRAFAAAQLAGLPAHIALGVNVAGLLLAVGALTRGSAFGRMTPSAQANVVAGWERSRLPSTRLYLRLVRSLVLFGAYDTVGADA